MQMFSHMMASAGDENQQQNAMFGGMGFGLFPGMVMPNMQQGGSFGNSNAPAASPSKNIEKHVAPLVPNKNGARRT